MNMNSIGGVYQKSSNAVKTSKPAPKTIGEADSSIKNGSNADKVEISPVAAQQYETYKVKNSVMGEIKSADNPSKVAEIKEQVANDSYYVSTEKIAEKIMKHLGM